MIPASRNHITAFQGTTELKVSWFLYGKPMGIMVFVTENI